MYDAHTPGPRADATIPAAWADPHVPAHRAEPVRRAPLNRLFLVLGMVALVGIALMLSGCGGAARQGNGTFQSGQTNRSADAKPDSGASGASEDGKSGGKGDSGDSGGSADGGSDGGTDGGDGHDGVDPGWPDDDVAPAAEDCVSYNPSNLTIEDLGATGWRMRDGGHAMVLFDTKTDAENGVKVARNHTRMCFIGRNNTRSDRYRYIVYYWKGSSGLAPQPVSSPDCIGYDPADAHVESVGDLGWRVVADDHALVLLDTQADAERAKIVAQSQGNLCFIGRDNTRSNRYGYITEYWR